MKIIPFFLVNELSSVTKADLKMKIIKYYSINCINFFIFQSLVLFSFKRKQDLKV